MSFRAITHVSTRSVPPRRLALLCRASAMPPSAVHTYEGILVATPLQCFRPGRVAAASHARGLVSLFAQCGSSLSATVIPRYLLTIIFFLNTNFPSVTDTIYAPAGASTAISELPCRNGSDITVLPVMSYSSTLPSALELTRIVPS